MKIYSVSGAVLDDPSLSAEYKAARAIGNVRVGEGRLFFRAGMKVYALAQDELRRCYRRVMRVPMKMCCGTGNLDVEYLVVEGERGELAQLQLPGTRAAKALMALMQEKLPGLELTAPAKAEAKA